MRCNFISLLIVCFHFVCFLLCTLLEIPLHIPYPHILMSSYDPLYPWAALALRREISSMTTTTRVRAFGRHQTLCQSNEDDAIVSVCDNDEPICRDGSKHPFSLHRFTNMYITVLKN